VNPEHFAARLKELRVAAGLTQPELAERAGMSKAGVADLEQGRREPSWSTVLALCAALGVGCDAFQQEPMVKVRQGRGRPPKGEMVGSTGARKKPKKGAGKSAKR
jgi:putative transcriptional regulator